VRATEALVGFGQQMEHAQSGSFRQVSLHSLCDSLMACCLHDLLVVPSPLYL
jgi:hypothetical protein